MRRRALVIPISMRPGAAASLQSALKQLQTCTTGAGLAWAGQPPAVFLVILGEAKMACNYDPDLVREVAHTLQKIRRPVVGVVTNSVCYQAAELLQSCDHVLSADDAEFMLEANSCAGTCAGEAAARGLVQRVLPVAEVGPEIAALEKQLQAMTPAKLASIKVDWLCAKASQLLTPVKVFVPRDIDKCSGAEVYSPQPVEKRGCRSLACSTILELDSEDEDDQHDAGSTLSPCSSMGSTRSFSDDSILSVTELACTPQ